MKRGRRGWLKSARPGGRYCAMCRTARFGARDRTASTEGAVMAGLRVLIANHTLGPRAGSELYARDVALALLARGHRPVAYSTHLGPVADELRRATVPVVDDL